MRYYLLFILFLFFNRYGYAQIISQFTWDTNPVTSADIGPDAISVSSSAISSAGGVGGTNGLNPSLPKADLFFTIPGSAIFDVDGIDISFDTQRDESSGTFVKRGNSLIIRGVSNLSVSYRVDNGAGAFNTVSSGNVYSIPNDNTFRNYRFYYLPTTGFGALLVNGTIVWSNDGPDNRPMYWNGAGDFVIGEGVDGSGSNRTLLDNLVIAEVTAFPLPIELVSFDAHANNSQVDLKWVTATEISNDFFTVERSIDLKSWEEVLVVGGAGNSNQIIEYFDSDLRPLIGRSYYRLKQTDYNGSNSSSNPVPVSFQQDLTANQNELNVYPNPVSVGSLLNLELNELGKEVLVVLRDAQGREVCSKIILDVEDEKLIGLPIRSNLPTGLYFVVASSENKIYSKKIVVR